MDFKARTSYLILAALLALAAIFTYEALQESFWANVAVGVLICLILFSIMWAIVAERSPSVHEPHFLPPDARHDLRFMLDQTPIPLVRYVEGEHPEALNKAARTLFHTDLNIVQEGEALIRVINEASLGTKTIISVLGRQFAVSVSEIASDQGHARLATFTDVQIEMHKAEAAALKDTLQVLSHEIMNSLTPVASLAEIADSYVASEPADIASAREALETLSRRTTSLSRFIEAYRSVARLPDPVLQPVSLGRLVKDITELFVSAPANNDVAFHLDIPDGLPRLNLDEAQISQAIINVITNALEATEATGRAREITVSMSEARQNLIICISDNGEGVPHDLRANLFSAFATTKPKGTGTGLNLARQIMLAHGGNLQLLDDRPNDAGEAAFTTFAFTFPVRR